MFLVDFAVALAVALVLSVLIGAWAGKTYSRASVISLFVILLLATWAGGIWMMPVGPAIQGVYWAPYVLVGILFALLLTVVSPSRKPHPGPPRPGDINPEPAVTAVVMGFFFWMLLIFLLLAIGARYA